MDDWMCALKGAQKLFSVTASTVGAEEVCQPGQALTIHQNIVCLEIAVPSTMQSLETPAEACCLTHEAAQGLDVPTSQKTSWRTPATAFAMLRAGSTLLQDPTGMCPLKSPDKLADGLTAFKVFEHENLAQVASAILAQESSLWKQRVAVGWQTRGGVQQHLSLEDLAELPARAARANALGQSAIQLNHEDVVASSAAEPLCSLCRGRAATENGLKTLTAKKLKQSCWHTTRFHLRHLFSC
mmetsp:Transcript_63701/g.114662  ORF Transcript_63701/g.114662 Transcript_63701/m.114662 type:complete len:241 (-) Transcript_63701:749-1471(-)